ncbi:uncharacterized protein At4g06598 isoform X2 [Cucumis melo]|uniref:Uncharacterized protein At4g06598 isoform X1 n=2 Tax=Cucumis melo TaxID=3656 RepID=A0A1S3BEP8_CUCME|nr:uncharacterized protein At4g06598 isoform X1 [Cucumis melo]XP_050947245.1 uncharacterized protein At4g06598 isoform X2 [Cucumis melo]
MQCRRRNSSVETCEVNAMENSKVLSNMRNMISSGKHALLPPKSPVPSGSSTYSEYLPNPIVGSRAVQNPRVGNVNHHRTSSESLLMEEQPSWLDDLLNEPETPVQRGGHRRSSSDSFAYLDAGNVSNENYTQDDSQCKNMYLPSWASQDFDSHQASLYMKPSWNKQKNRTRELPPTTLTTNPGGRPSAKNSILLESLRTLSTAQEANEFSSTTTEKLDSAETALPDRKLSERMDSSHVKPGPTDTDNKRAKQQFAQRSRVRKLQYIAELERNVQALQANGSEVSAELEFLSRQNLILGMENKALKQRLESLSQEQLIKYLEHEVLEKEIGRLRMLYQQQQQPKPPPSNLKRTKSRDLETQFSKLSLRQKDSRSGSESVAGPVQI